jgi:putative FmdB family regulatory protein
MPTYDYECDACGHKFELYQSIMAPVETKCPKCNKKKLRRLIGTGAAIVFKGSGFYQTDYRSESYKKSASSDKKSSEGSAGGSSEGSKSESKSSAESTPKKEAAKESKAGGDKPAKKSPKPE